MWIRVPYACPKGDDPIAAGAVERETEHVGRPFKEGL